MPQVISDKLAKMFNPFSFPKRPEVAVLTARGRRIVMPVMILAVINFCTFYAVATNIGGDALNGNSENGHYYVSSHGVKTEVTRGMYIYSGIHAVTVIFTHAAVFVTLWYLFRKGEIRLKSVFD